MPDTLTLLILSDIHYSSHADLEAEPKAARYRLGREFVQRALNEAGRLCEPDAVIVLGDIVADGTASSAESDLTMIASLLRDTDLPVVAVPGNHDGDARRFLRIFGDNPGLHRVRRHCLFTFADPYAADESMTRPAADLVEFLRAKTEGPVIAIQHSPIYPDVDCTNYPFMPLNRREILAAYREKGVALSISGHYHQGQPPARKDGTLYATSPALVDEPFQFMIARIDGADAEVETVPLKRPEFQRLTDGHIHTHFGYCAVDVHPEPVRERIELFGVGGGFFVEHAPQLYLTDDEFWHARHVEEPGIIRRARKEGRDRIAAFRAEMARFARDGFGMGLEVELDKDGEMTLLEEDRQGWDRLLGALHWMPSNLPSDTPARRAASFMSVMERLVPMGIQVLAHPFRYFQQRRQPEMEELYRPLAQLLRQHNVAAEMNFHLNQPDPEFFRICLEEKVRIVVGTDSHCLYEVGDFGPHVRMLKEIGALPAS